MLDPISKTVTRMWDMLKSSSDLPKDITEPLIKKHIKKDVGTTSDKKAQLRHIVYGI